MLSYVKVGDKLPEALDAYQQGLNIRRMLVGQDSNTGWQRDLSVANEKVGDVLKAQGNFRKHWTPISEA
jgi:hypothetical protein